jgi:hypothetical protein
MLVKQDDSDFPPPPQFRKAERAQRRASRGRPVLSLRIVVSLLTAVIVLIVATITFAITYVTGAQSTEDMGGRFAASVADAGRMRFAATFTEPIKMQSALAAEFLRNSYTLPTDDADGGDFELLDRVLQGVIMIPLTMGDLITTSVITFDDGSAVTQLVYRNGTHDLIQLFRSNAKFITNSTTRCCARVKLDEYVLPSMTRVPNPVARFPVANDFRSSNYPQIRAVLSASSEGSWGTPLYTESTVPPTYAIPTARGLRNATHFLGLHAAAVSFARLREFLAELDRTANTVLFAIDGSTVVATTHVAQSTVVTRTTNRATAALPPANCASNLISSYPNATEWALACRSFLKDFPYDPARTVANDRTLTRPADDAIVMKRSGLQRSDISSLAQVSQPRSGTSSSRSLSSSLTTTCSVTSSAPATSPSPPCAAPSSSPALPASCSSTLCCPHCSVWRCTCGRRRGCAT